MSVVVIKDGKVVKDYKLKCDDFCELCGDCVYCYGENDCQASEDGIHLFLVEEE